MGAFLALAVLFYPTTLTWTARFLTLSEPAEPADLILVLGGNFWGPRPVLGAELGALGFAKKVLVSGPPYNGRPESELSIQFLVARGYPREMFLSFPNTSKSTIDEAVAVCPELKRLGAKKVLLVTSAYHSRRANLVFRLFCPAVRFRSIPQADEEFQIESWWKTKRYRTVFFSEWEKILGTLFWKYPEYLATGSAR